MGLLCEDLDHLPSPTPQPVITADKLVAIEQKYLRASSEVKERVSRNIERGPVGTLLKRATGFKCQVFEAFGFNPPGVVKPNGEHYVEVHHVMPVSQLQIGSSCNCKHHDSMR